MLFYKVLIFVILSLPSYAFSSAGYFSCSTDVGDINLKNVDGHLLYTLEKDGETKFEFKSRGAGYSGFSYSHYTRYKTDYFNVSFFNKGYKYIVFSNYEDGTYSRGVSVINIKTKKEYVNSCKSFTVDNLIELLGKLECDTTSSLGCE